MKTIKQMVLRLFFVLEIFVFVWMYLFGAQGVSALHALQEENYILEHQIQDMRADLHKLDQYIAMWEHEPFYKEKIAREQLQMVRRGDTIYYHDND